MRTSFWAVFMVIAIMSVAVGQELSKGNGDKGRSYFRQTCKKCHAKGAPGGEVTPLSKTASQWRAYFAKSKHGTGSLAQVMADQRLRDVQAFLVAHAADSDQPETCGR